MRGIELPAALTRLRIEQAIRRTGMNDLLDPALDELNAIGRRCLAAEDKLLELIEEVQR